MERTSNPIILITEPQGYNQNALDLYATVGTVVLGSEHPAQLLQQLATAQVAVVRLGLHFDESLLAQQALSLQCIVSPTTGLNHIDLRAAANKHIQIISLQGETAFLESIPSTAEFTFSLLLASTRNLVAANTHTLGGQWNRNLFKGKNLRHKTLGIIGLGRVGKQVARMALAFEMQVMAFDTDVTQKLPGVTLTNSIIDLVGMSDIISIHIPSANNDLCIHAGVLKKSKPEAIWINTSRGNVWDETAVAELVQSGHLYAVATDVLQHESNGQMLTNNVLWQAAQKHPRIIITPHIAGATNESMAATEHFVAKKWKSYWTQK